MPDNLSAKLYHSFDTELEAIWRSCQEGFHHYVFQSYDWLVYWQSTVGENTLGIEPIIVVVSDSRHALALFPFGIRRTAGVRVLEFLGGTQNDYNSPLIHPAYIERDMLESIWHVAEKKLPPHNVRSFSRLPDYLNNRINPWPAMLDARLTSAAYSASLPQTIAALEERVSARRRADSKRQLKRLSALGKPKFFFAESDAEHCLIIETMIAQKRQRYRDTGVRDIFSAQVIQDFYLNLSGKLGDTGRIHVSALSLNEEILATHWGVIYGDRYYWLMPSYAGGEWGKFSVGRLLLEQVMLWAIENGLKVFDFTTGDEEYKKVWCDRQLLIYDHVDYSSVRGMVFVYVLRLIACLKSNPTSRNLITSAVAGYRSLFKA
jgi:CelD/BcsL family acetyltransferase involved in cellulose biosynthesis